MVALEITGHGEPIVLLHGVGATRRIWRRVAPELATERMVLAPDLPGFGESPAVGDGFELASVADALAGALTSVDGLRGSNLARPRFDLVGNSLGGAVAFVLALRYPHLVRRLVLSAPAGFSHTPAWLAAVAGRLSGPATLARGLIGRPLAGSAVARRALLWGGIAQPERLPADVVLDLLTASLRATRYGWAIEAVLRADLRADLPELEVPLGLLWGERDRIVPVSALCGIRAIRPEVPVVTLPDVAHVPQVESPCEFVSAVRSLLERLGERT